MNEQMQKEFEMFVSGSLPINALLKVDGSYVNSLIRAYWDIWQASRAALVVELSSLPEASYNTTGTCYVSHVEDALEAAGVKYK